MPRQLMFKVSVWHPRCPSRLDGFLSVTLGRLLVGWHLSTVTDTLLCHLSVDCCGVYAAALPPPLGHITNQVLIRNVCDLQGHIFHFTSLL